MMTAPTKTLPTPKQVFRNVETFASTFLYILDKDKRLVKLHFNPLQRRFLRERTGRDLILKPRQIGFSTAIQADLFYRAVTRTSATVTLSHEDKSTQKFRRMTKRFYDNLPENFRPARKYDNAVLATYPDFDSESEIFTAGNTDTGRSGTYTDVHASEVAFYKDAQAIVAGIMQGGNPSIAMESTPNGAQGYFYNLCMEALDGNSIWKLHFFRWWDHPEYATPLEDGETFDYADDELELVETFGLSPEQIKWRRGKQQELKHEFPQEYPEDPVKCFLLSGQGYFGDVDFCYTAPTDASPHDDHTYVAGLDFGQTTDYTVLSVGDRNAGNQVDLLMVRQLAWGEMRRRVVQKCKQWGITKLIAEKNSMGSTNIEELNKELYAAGCQTSVEAFETTNISKAQIMTALHEAIYSNELRLLPIDSQKHQMRAFQAKQTLAGNWQLSAPDGEHDDIVIANGLMQKAMTSPSVWIYRG